MARLLALAVWAFLLLPIAARAQSCSFTISDMNFGSPAVVSGGAVDTTATLTATCTGYPATNICVGLDAGSGGYTGSQRLMTGPSSTLKYLLSGWGAEHAVGIKATPALGGVPYHALSGASNFTYTATIYGRLFAGQSTAALGSYEPSFSGTQAEAYTLSSGTNCTTGTSGGSLYATFNALATVATDCAVSATALSFGSHGPLTANTDATSTVTVTCTSTTPYTVGLGNGLTGTGPTARKMTNGSNSITYALYRDSARSLAWGTAGGTTASGTGTGSGQAFTVYGRVPPQTTPAAATYSDTVGITVSY